MFESQWPLKVKDEHAFYKLLKKISAYK